MNEHNNTAEYMNEHNNIVEQNNNCWIQPKWVMIITTLNKCELTWEQSRLNVREQPQRHISLLIGWSNGTSCCSLWERSSAIWRKSPHYVMVYCDKYISHHSRHIQDPINNWANIITLRVPDTVHLYPCNAMVNIQSPTTPVPIHNHIVTEAKYCSSHKAPPSPHRPRDPHHCHTHKISRR